jgi:hypothetical protein
MQRKAAMHLAPREVQEGAHGVSAETNPQLHISLLVELKRIWCCAANLRGNCRVTPV